ncbi:hypothetical protein Y1Q_0021490 [Alligator mississippiensis]|uniref:Uncharacterized protein n=1 Tax=Alligator mississippiensis TaxID=8496 RepID=A0A151PAS9_ALLMI|nr:hypothetical protein Y1Q_0021490 [Alligator mississippiensis]
MDHQDRWQADDVTHEETQDQHEEAQDQVDQEFQVQLLSLEYEWMGALQGQNAILVQVVQAKNNDCQVLDTVLALVVMVPNGWPLTLAPPAPWQLPTTQQLTCNSRSQEPPPWVWHNPVPPPGPSPAPCPGFTEE